MKVKSTQLAGEEMTPDRRQGERRSIPDSEEHTPETGTPDTGDRGRNVVGHGAQFQCYISSSIISYPHAR